jgi:hypothetical protein
MHCLPIQVVNLRGGKDTASCKWYSLIMKLSTIHLSRTSKVNQIDSLMYIFLLFSI